MYRTQHLNAKYDNKRRDSESLIGISSYVAGIDFISISVVIISRYHLHLAYPIYVPFRLLSATYDQTEESGTGSFTAKFSVLTPRTTLYLFQIVWFCKSIQTKYSRSIWARSVYLINFTFDFFKSKTPFQTGLFLWIFLHPRQVRHDASLFTLLSHRLRLKGVCSTCRHVLFRLNPESRFRQRKISLDGVWRQAFSTEIIHRNGLPRWSFQTRWLSRRRQLIGNNSNFTQWNSISVFSYAVCFVLPVSSLSLDSNNFYRNYCFHVLKKSLRGAPRGHP